MILNLKCIFSPFVLFYYLHTYLKYKSLLFTMHSVVFNHIFKGGGLFTPNTILLHILSLFKNWCFNYLKQN